MLKKIITTLSVLIFALFVLFTSVLRASSTNYSFYEKENLAYLQNSESTNTNPEEVDIKYYFPYPGKILPDNTLWFLKAFRDKIWLWINSNPTRKAELLLLFSDKRLVSSKALFEKGKPHIAFSTLSKAEKYLEKSLIQNNENREKGIDTTSFELKLATASLKHYQEIRDLFSLAPDDLKPEINETLNYPKRVYEAIRDNLLSKGVVPPANPFGQ